MKSRVLLPLLALLLAACNLPLSLNVVARAWIDAPLDGSQVPLGAPVSLSFHASDQSGVARIETSVDGVVLHTLDNPDPKQLLVYLTDVWTPISPGVHVIRVRAQNTAGIWGDPDQVSVTVGSVTATPTPTATTTPGLSATPTAFTGFSAPLLSSNGFYYGAGGCSPDRVSVAVIFARPQDVKVMVFFFKLTDVASGKTGGWSEGQSMDPAGSGAYQVTLVGDVLGPTAGFARASLSYQFVAQLNAGASQRSPVYTDLELGRCSNGILPGFKFDPQFHGFDLSTPTTEKVK